MCAVPKIRWLFAEHVHRNIQGCPREFFPPNFTRLGTTPWSREKKKSHLSRNRDRNTPIPHKLVPWNMAKPCDSWPNPVISQSRALKACGYIDIPNPVHKPSRHLGRERGSSIWQIYRYDRSVCRLPCQVVFDVVVSSILGGYALLFLVHTSFYLDPSFSFPV